MSELTDRESLQRQALELSESKLACLPIEERRTEDAFIRAITKSYLPDVTMRTLFPDQDSAAKFKENQAAIIKTIEQKMQEYPATTKLNDVIKSLAKDYFPTEGIPQGQLASNALKGWLFRHPDRKSFPCVMNSPGIIADQYIGEVEHLPYIDDRKTLSFFLCKKLYDNHGIDVPATGVIHEWSSFVATEEQKERLEALFKERQDPNSLAKVKPGIAGTHSIKLGSNIEAGISNFFEEETRRPKRGDRREAGGPARLGPQKPDLWKPEV